MKKIIFLLFALLSMSMGAQVIVHNQPVQLKDLAAGTVNDSIVVVDGTGLTKYLPVSSLPEGVVVETDPVFTASPAFNTTGTNTGDQDLSNYVTLDGGQTITGAKIFNNDLDVTGAVTGGILSHAGGAAYTTNSAQNGNHITMTGASSVVTLDDASVNVGNQFHIYNKSGGDLTWAFGTGDVAYQGSLPPLPNGSYAWATLESANNWSVIVGGTAGSGGGSSTLSGLTDTNITTPSNGQALVYNSTGGNWENQTLSVTGDMLKTTYDTDTDNIVDNAEAVGGVAITDIARTDVAETFSSTISATNLSGTNTGDNAVNSLYSGLVSNATHTGDVTGATALTIAVDAVDIPMLSATGTPDNTTFLRGDNTWATPDGGVGWDDYTSAGSYTTNTAQDGNTVVLTAGTTITLDDASVTVGDQFQFENRTGASVSFAFGTGDSAFQGTLADLTNGSYAYAKLYATNTWSVVVGGDTGGGGGATDLGYTASASNGIVTSSTGTDATLTLANGTNAGLLTPADFTKLSNTSGTNTGDQTITLTGDVTGSGTGSFATTIASDAVDIAMLSATGTPSATTYLRGDNTWATVSGGGGGNVSTSGTPVTNDYARFVNGTDIEGRSYSEVVSDLNVPTLSAQNTFAQNQFMDNLYVQKGTNGNTKAAIWLDADNDTSHDLSMYVEENLGTYTSRVSSNGGELEIYALGGTTFISSQPVDITGRLTVGSDPITTDGVGNTTYNASLYSQWRDYTYDSFDARWTLGAGWTDGTNSLVASSASSTAALNITGFWIGDYVKVAINVSAYTSGSITVSVEGTGSSITIDDLGLWELWIDPATTQHNDLVITGSSFSGTIGNVRVRGISSSAVNHTIVAGGFNNPLNITNNPTSQTTTITYDRAIPAISMTGNYTIADNYLGVMFINDGATARTITVPDTLTLGIGDTFSVVKSGTGDVSIDPTGTTTINGSTATITLSTQYQAYQIVHVSGDDYVLIGN